MIRRRGLIAIALIAILALALLATVYFLQSGSPAVITTTSTLESNSIPVGVFLYLWYGNATTGVGGLGSPGWNSPSCPGGGAAADNPSLGYYVSDSNRTFQTQIDQMQSAGIAFAIISWWGPFTKGEAGAINKATLDLFRYLKDTNSTFRIAIMIDAFSGTCNPLLPNVPMSQVYDYIHSNFASPYKQWYFDWEGKPLLLVFNSAAGSYPLYNDTRFTSKEIGNYVCRPITTCPDHSLDQKLDWIFWETPAGFSQGQGGTGVNMTNDIGNPVISSDGEVTIVPRIDSYYNYESGHQGGYLKFDSTLQEGLYQFEWSYVLSHQSSVKLVLIYSWNEWHERSAIEPHSEPGNALSENYLLNMTSHFVNLLPGQKTG